MNQKEYTDKIDVIAEAEARVMDASVAIANIRGLSLDEMHITAEIQHRLQQSSIDLVNFLRLLEVGGWD